jgi:hypothetical protein
MKLFSQNMGVPPPLRGYQVVSVEEGQVCIYGDPEGLRSLADLLRFAADLDQSKLENGQPEDDSFHCHVLPGQHLSVPSLPLTVGRVDTAAGRFRQEVFPLPKRNRKVRRK